MTRHALIDAHNHLGSEVFSGMETEILSAMEAAGIGGAMVNGSCEEDWDRVAAVENLRPWLRVSFGVHPWDAGDAKAGWEQRLRARLETNPTAHVGEIGVDEWMLSAAAPDDPRLLGMRRAPMDEQIAVMGLQLGLANELGRAATVHCLSAWDPLLKALKTAELPKRGFLLHAYGGPVSLIAPLAALGAYFSFNGAFLDASRIKRLKAFEVVPRDRLLVETDAPAMALPREWRTHKLRREGKIQEANHPANLEAAYRGLAAFLGVAVEELAETVQANYERLFGVGRR